MSDCFIGGKIHMYKEKLHILLKYYNRLTPQTWLVLSNRQRFTKAFKNRVLSADNQSTTSNLRPSI